jgi:hypothetical protein
MRESSSGPCQNTHATTRTSARHVRRQSTEVDRARLSADPALVVDAELRACEQDGSAEALDLEVALQLRPEAEADAAGREQEER